MMMSDQLPEGWVWTTLGQIADAQSGAGFPKSYQGLPSGDYPLAKVSDISEATKTNGGIINKANNYLSEANAKKIGAKVFPVGTTLFAKIGEAVRLNRRAINTCPILADNNVMGLIPDTGSVTPRYLFLFMHSVDLYEYSQATTVPSVRKTDIEQIPIPLPPLAEQERIVAKIEALFSQLDAGVAALRRIQAALKRYKASVLKAACEGRLVGQDPTDEPAEALLRRLGKAPLVDDDLPALPEGWCWVRVGDIGKVKGGKRLPAGHDYSDEMTAFPYIRVVDFHEFSVRSNELKYLKPETQAAIRQYTISKDDVYISIAGSIGKVGLIPEHLDRANLTENAAKITELQAICNKFLAYCLASPISQEQISESTISTTQPKLALFRIEKIQIPIPPLPEQQRIVAKIEQCLSVVAEVETMVAALLARSVRLRQAILKQAFEGKLI